MSNQLTAGQKLTAGQQITSNNGKAYLTQQADGNLVLYPKGGPPAIWASGTVDPSAANYAVMQSDGNFVIYSSAGAAAWSTQTSQNPGAYLQLEDTGDIVVYSAAGAPLWSSNTVQWQYTPSTVAGNAIWPTITTCAPGQAYFACKLAPGWEYKARLNGADYVDAPFGEANICALPMANDTIIHVASMSKPVCITAFVAMLDDWTALADGVKGNGVLAGTSHVDILMAAPRGGPNPPLQPVGKSGSTLPLPSIAAPLWLLPALSSQSLAQQLVGAGLLSITPSNLQSAVNSVASHGGVCIPEPAVPPGYAGLMTQVIKNVAVPTPNDPFLPLIAANLQAKAQSLGVAYQPGHGMAQVKLAQIITHTSTIPDGFTDSAVNAEFPNVNFGQPTDGGAVTGDIWTYLLAFVSQPANGQSGYKNDDYNVLGGVVSACVGEDYDDYVYARLFSDPQFSDLRRYVVDPTNAATYYTGLEPNFSNGIPFPDYRGFGACGGFYYTADQITQWLYVLKTGEAVQRTTGSGSSGPLVSQSGLDMLFGTTGYFTAGAINTLSGWTTYTHDGGTGLGDWPNSGSVNGNMGIAVAPNGDVMTAFFCANGGLDGTAPYNAAFPAILQYAYPPTPG